VYAMIAMHTRILTALIDVRPVVNWCQLSFKHRTLKAFDLNAG
jgi:hypothetical protein